MSLKVKNYLFFIAFTLGSALTSLIFPGSQRLEAQQAQQSLKSWEPVSGAAYYQGTIKTDNDKPLRIRTSSQWLLLEGDVALDLDAYDSSGQNLGPVILKDQPLGGQANVAPKVEEDIDYEAEYPEPPEEEETAADLEVTQPNRYGSSGTIGLSLGIGKETLTARGGSSEYKGTSGIGGTHINFRWRNHGTPTLVAASIGAHYFNTDIESQSGSNSSSDGEQQFLRLSARLGWMYDLTHVDGNPKALTAALGLGFAHFRLPNLRLEDKTSGAANLENRTAFGPEVVALVLIPGGVDDEIGIGLNWLPMVFTKDTKGMSTNVSVIWRHLFDGQLFSELGVHYLYETLETEIDCQSIAGCEEKSTSASKYTQGRLGVGVVF
jgi:hypothetical protein